MKLSIIIPVYNEEKTISLVVGKVLTIKLPVDKEVIVVNDGSSDATGTKLQSIKNKKVKVLTHQKNQGKGAAVRTGIQEASGDFILIQDADLEYDPKDIPMLIDPILSEKTEVVYGTRLKRLPDFSRDERTIQFFVHYLGNKFLSLLTSVLYGQWITDMETGYKLFPKKALVKTTLVSRSFDFEPEITAKLLKKGFHILEVPITTNPRGYEEGKKLNTVRDGLIALWTLIKFRVKS